MTQIPIYALYGETEHTDDPEFLHIERMGERARLLKGRAAPHVHRQMFQFLFALDGRCTIEIEDTSQTVNYASAIYIPAGTVHSFNFNADKSDGWIITSSENFFPPAAGTSSKSFFTDNLWRSPAIVSYQHDQEGKEQIRRTMTQIHTEFKNTALDRNLALKTLLTMVLIQFRRKLEDNTPQTAKNYKDQDAFLAFRRLLEQHYSEHLSLLEYARRLKLNPARLKKICINSSGKSPHELIQCRLTLEAQRLLIYTAASAVQIAEELGFQDPAYFSRFIKKRLGLTPLEFRRQKQSGNLQATQQ